MDRRLRVLLFLSWLLFNNNNNNRNNVTTADALILLSRREAIVATTIASNSMLLFPSSLGGIPSNQNNNKPTIINRDYSLQNFEYSPTWTGTGLKLMTLEDASSSSSCWTMGKWPDPILRKAASPVTKDMFGSPSLYKAALLLKQTAILNHAVGLAAQQCAVNASMIYLQLNDKDKSITMINPIIIKRSDEIKSRVWDEECLVLPPTFVARGIVRDDWIVVRYQTASDYSYYQEIKLHGEAARACQHEMDHDVGILTLDHVDLMDMENDIMRDVEKEGHDERQAQAFSRFVVS